MVTLEQLLAARDARALHQQELLAACPGCSLVCLTVQLPGPVKRNSDSLVVGGAGLAALLDRFGSTLSHVQVRDLESGYEAYLLVPLPERMVKSICCSIEEQHPLGRLMDIDVVGAAGIPLSREDLGLPPRRCLLCEQEARYCMRAHTHSRDALNARIQEMINQFTTNGIQKTDAGGN